MSAADAGVPAGPSPLDRGRLRARLAAGQATVGTFVGAASPVTAEACAAAGVGRAGSEVLGVVQIESASALEQVEQIAALDGVDVLFVGPQDLSFNLGVPVALDSPTYLAAVDRVRAAAGRRGKACGLLVGDGAAAAARLAEGWSFVAIGSDATLLAATVTAELARARPSTPDLRGGQT